MPEDDCKLKDWHISLFHSLLGRQLHAVSTADTHASTWISHVFSAGSCFSVRLVSALALGALPAILGSHPPEIQIILVCSCHSEAISAENHLQKETLHSIRKIAGIKHVISSTSYLNTALQKIASRVTSSFLSRYSLLHCVTVYQET